MTDLIRDEDFADEQMLIVCAHLDQMGLAKQLRKTRAGAYEITVTIQPYRRVVGYARS